MEKALCSMNALRLQIYVSCSGELFDLDSGGPNVAFLRVTDYWPDFQLFDAQAARIRSK